MKRKIAYFLYSGYVVLVIGLLGGRISGQISNFILNVVYFVIFMMILVFCRSNYFAKINLVQKSDCGTTLFLNRTLMVMLIPLVIVSMINCFW